MASALPSRLFDTDPDTGRVIRATDGNLFGTLVLPASVSAVPTTARERREDEARRLLAAAAETATHAYGDGTRKAYRSAWRGYTAWCEGMGYEPLSGDPQQIMMYLQGLSEKVNPRTRKPYTVSVLRVHLAAINAAYDLAGIGLNKNDAVLKVFLKGAVNRRGRKPDRKAAPLTSEHLKRIMVRLRDAGTACDPAALRSRALLLTLFGSACRRSEIQAATIADVSFVDGKGIEIAINRSKTDQTGEGHLVAVHGSPDPDLDVVAALKDWLAIRPHAHPTDPLFVRLDRGGKPTSQPLSGESISLIVKAAAESIGLDPEQYSGHSTRRGLATEAGEEDEEIQHIARQMRHAKLDTTAGYLTSRSAWRNNITRKILGKVTGGRG